jgi:hypothetical protein
MALLKAKANPVCYDGFEPSGRMHIAQGILKAINVNRLTRAGCVFKFWVADWFALLNNKMGGDLKKIRTVGQYMVEVRTLLGACGAGVWPLVAARALGAMLRCYGRAFVPRHYRCYSPHRPLAAGDCWCVGGPRGRHAPPLHIHRSAPPLRSRSGRRRAWT